MSADVLSDLLRAVRLRGAVFYYIEGADPWVAETPPAAEIIPAIMPGAGAMFEFHCGHPLDNAVDESNRRRPGGEAVLERMSEMMWIKARARPAVSETRTQRFSISHWTRATKARRLSPVHSRPWQASRRGSGGARAGLRPSAGQAW